MSNSIETPIDIDFFGGIDIGIDIDSGYPWKIDIDIGIDHWHWLFEFWKIDILKLNVNGKSKPINCQFVVHIQDKLIPKYKEKGKWELINWFIDLYFTSLHGCFFWKKGEHWHCYWHWGKVSGIAIDISIDKVPEKELTLALHWKAFQEKHWHWHWNWKWCLQKHCHWHWLPYFAIAHVCHSI